MVLFPAIINLQKDNPNTVIKIYLTNLRNHSNNNTTIVSNVSHTCGSDQKNSNSVKPFFVIETDRDNTGIKIQN